jgi:uncharacterized delta-60 repeat protein
MTGEGLRIRKTSKLATAAASVIACVLCLGLVSAAQAAPGALDPTFSGDGKETTDFGGGNDAAYGVVVQPDGKIVVAGSASGDFAVARYDTDGSLDATFSGDGKQTGGFGFAGAAAVALQPDGKIVVAGGNGEDFALARFNLDGSLDASFSGGGRLTTDFGDTVDTANGVALQSDGKIVAVGSAGYGESNVFAIARYNPDGSLDTGFSGDGMEAIGMGSDSVAYDVALQPDGRIVVAGYGDGGFWGTYAFALVRYNPDGSLDMSFAGWGGVMTDFGWSDVASAVAIQPDGKIVAVGVGDFMFAVARYNADGSLDASFSEDGKQATSLGGNDGAGGVAVQPDGRIVVVGRHDDGSYGSFDFALARYNPDGSLDASFSGGAVLTDFGRHGPGTDVALQPDGKIVAVGGYGDFQIARYQGSGSGASDTTPPETTITGGPGGTTTDGTPTFEFGSSEGGATFACRVDGNAFSPCSSPYTTSPLGDGPHAFEVRATDAAGNVDPSPATRSFIVDATSPDVTVTAPADGATVSGNVAVTADAHDNTIVAGVQFTLDGMSLGIEDTVAPYAATWDTRTAANGPHVLSALARDSAGNLAAATDVSVSVDNDKSSPTVPTNLSAVPVSSSQIDLAWSAATDNVGVTGYRVSRNGAVVTTTSATSFPDAGLAASTAYTYSVTAFDAAGNVSSASTPVSATTPAAGLVAAYRFGEGAGTTTADGSPNANNGALVNGAAWTSAGKFGSAINFDGVNDYVRVADSASLDLGRTGTVEAWVKLDTLNRWHGVVAKGNTNSDSSHNYAVEISSSNRWLCILGSGTSSVVCNRL